MGNRRILIIGNDPHSRQLVTDILTGWDFEVLSAPDGTSGIEIARVTQPAVILLDMATPGIDWISTSAFLKQDPLLGDIPVVGITDLPDLLYIQEAFRAGVEFFLPKPFLADTLVAVVDLVAQLARCGPVMHRCHPRFPVKVPVRCLAGDVGTTRRAVGQTGNMSLSGLLLVLPEGLPPATVFRLQLRLPEATITAEGARVWQGPQPMHDGRTRHGVRLLRFVEDVGLVRYRQYLGQVAAAHTPVSQAAA